jgi:hypothetical protein
VNFEFPSPANELASTILKETPSGKWIVGSPLGFEQPEVIETNGVIT